MAYILDTTDIPAQERMEAVRTAMRYASAPCHVIHEDAGGPVHARMEVWDLGNATIFTQRSSGIRLLRTDKLARQDAMRSSTLPGLSSDGPSRNSSVMRPPSRS